MLKSVADRDLIEACRAAMRGEPFLYPGAVTALIRDYLKRDRARATACRRASSRPREEEIVKLIAEGNSAKEIADDPVHQRQDRRPPPRQHPAKLGMRDRLDLTRYAIRAGLIEP